jgi:hypothetical protein
MKEKETTAMYLILKQQENWAKGKKLVSGKIIDGEESKDKNYLETIEDNLFPVDQTKGLRPENIVAYNKGGGSETKTITHRPKMSALHSSSALVVNLFQYWQNQEINKTPLLIALGLVNDIDKVGVVEIKFEEKLQIKYVKFGTPNLDVMIKFEDQIIAIESKFTEPYIDGSNKNSEMQDSYIKKESLWKEIPHIEKLANAIHAQNYQIENCEIKESIEVLRKTKRLDAAQLIKHILGLRTDDDKEILKNKEIILLYLWYDVPNSEEAKEHQEEIEAFASIAKADGINFHHITYQKVINKLNELCPEECHQDYINYLNQRYNQQ